MPPSGQQPPMQCSCTGEYIRLAYPYGSDGRSIKVGCCDNHSLKYVPHLSLADLEQIYRDHPEILIERTSSNIERLTQSTSKGMSDYTRLATKLSSMPELYARNSKPPRSIIEGDLEQALNSLADLRKKRLRHDDRKSRILQHGKRSEIDRWLQDFDVLKRAHDKQIHVCMVILATVDALKHDPRVRKLEKAQRDRRDHEDKQKQTRSWINREPQHVRWEDNKREDTALDDRLHQAQKMKHAMESRTLRDRAGRVEHQKPKDSKAKARPSTPQASRQAGREVPSTKPKPQPSATNGRPSPHGGAKPGRNSGHPEARTEHVYVEMSGPGSWQFHM